MFCLGVFCVCLFPLLYHNLPPKINSGVSMKWSVLYPGVMSVSLTVLHTFSEMRGKNLTCFLEKGLFVTMYAVVFSPNISQAVVGHNFFLLLLSFNIIGTFVVIVIYG